MFEDNNNVPDQGGMVNSTLQQGQPRPMPQQGAPRPIPSQNMQRPMPRQGVPQQGVPQQGVPQQGVPRPMPQQGRPMPQQGAPRPIPQQGRPMPQQGAPRLMPQQGAPRPMPQQGGPRPMPQQGAPRPMPQQGASRQAQPIQGQPRPVSQPGRPIQQGTPSQTQPMQGQPGPIPQSGMPRPMPQQAGSVQQVQSRPTPQQINQDIPSKQVENIESDGIDSKPKKGIFGKKEAKKDDKQDNIKVKQGFFSKKDKNNEDEQLNEADKVEVPKKQGLFGSKRNKAVNISDDIDSGSTENIEQPVKKKGLFGRKQDRVEDIQDNEVNEEIEETEDIDESEELESVPIKKKGLFSRKQSNSADLDIPVTNKESSEDMVLYIISDKKQPGLINYFRECGLKVSNVFSDITTAKNSIIMQSMPTRIVIIDSGMGKFTTATMRSELIDMLGISDEQNRTTVFYTDSALKVDTMSSLGKAGKVIDWIVYSSTHVVAATILNYNESYVYDMEESGEDFDSTDSILSMKGMRVIVDDHGAPGQAPLVNMDIKGFSSKAILDNMVNSDQGELIGFNIKL